MIRCPSCGRRLRDAAPVCATHGTPPPVAEQPDDTTPFVVPTPKLPVFRVRRTLGQGGFGAVFLAERISDGTAGRHQGRARRQRLAGESLMREADALVGGRRPARPGGVRARRARRRLGLRGDGVRAGADAGRSTDRAAGPDAARRVRAPTRWRSWPRSRRRTGAASSTATSSRRTSSSTDSAPSCSTSAWSAASARAGDRVESTKEEAPAGHARVHVARAVRGAHRHRRPQRHLRAGGDLLRDAGGRAAVLGQLGRGAAEPPQPPAAGAVAPGARSRSRSRTRSCAASPRIPSGGSPASPSFGARCRRGSRPSARARRRRPAAARGAAAAGRGGRQGRAAQSRRRPRASGARSRCCSSRARATSPPCARRCPASARSWRTRAGAQYVLAFGHEVGDNPTRAAANAGEMLIARGLAKRALVDLASVSIQARARRDAPLPEPAVRQEGAVSRRGRIPPGVLLSPAAVEVLPDLPVEPVPGRPGVVRLQKAAQAAERTTTRMGVAPLVGPRRAAAHAARVGARGGHRRAPTITTLLGEPGYGKTHLAQMLVQHLEVLPALADAVRARQGGAGRRRRADHARAPAARRWRSPTRRRRISDAALLAERLGRRDRQGGLGRRRGRDGVGAARAPGAAGAGRRAGRPAFGGGARARRGAARGRASGRWRWCSRTRSSSTRRRSTRSSTRRWPRRAARSGSASWVGPSFGRGRTGWAGRAAERQSDHAAGAGAGRRGRAGAPPALAGRERAGERARAAWPSARRAIPLLLVELVRGLKRDGLVRKSEQGAELVPRHRRARSPARSAARAVAGQPRDRVAAARSAGARAPGVGARRRVQQRRDRGRAAGARRAARGRDAARRRHRPAPPDPRAASWRATAAGGSGSVTRCCATRSISRFRAAARGDPPRRLRLLPAPGPAARRRAPAADGVPCRAQRSAGRGGAPLPRSRRPRARAARATSTPSCCISNALENLPDEITRGDRSRRRRGAG